MWPNVAVIPTRDELADLPSSVKGIQVTPRLSPKLFERIEEIVKVSGMSRNEVMRYLLASGVRSWDREQSKR
jgi:hypothetical protein